MNTLISSYTDTTRASNTLDNSLDSKKNGLATSIVANQGNHKSKVHGGFNSDPISLIERLSDQISNGSDSATLIQELQTAFLLEAEHVDGKQGSAVYSELNHKLADLIANDKLGEEAKELRKMLSEFQALINSQDEMSKAATNIHTALEDPAWLKKFVKNFTSELDKLTDAANASQITQAQILDGLENIIAGFPSPTKLTPASGNASANGNDYTNYQQRTSVIMIALIASLELMQMNYESAKVFSMAAKSFDKIMSDLSALQSFLTLISKFYKDVLGRRQEYEADNKKGADKGSVDWDDAEIVDKDFVKGYTHTGKGASLTLYFSPGELPDFVKENSQLMGPDAGSGLAGKYAINLTVMSNVLKQASEEVAMVLPGKDVDGGELYNDWHDGMKNSIRLDALNEQVANKIKTVNDKLSSITSQESLFQNGAERGQRFFETVANMIQQLVIR